MDQLARLEKLNKTVLQQCYSALTFAKTSCHAQPGTVI